MYQFFIVLALGLLCNGVSWAFGFVAGVALCLLQYLAREGKTQ